MIYKRQWYRSTRPCRSDRLPATCLIVVVLVGVLACYNYQNVNKGAAGVYPQHGRHLLSTVSWEQCDFEIGRTRDYSDPDSWLTPRNQAYGWLACYVLCILIVFVAIAIVCDDFFVPSLESISDRLNLSEDVAGATFMAAGSSAPELFTSVAGVAVQSDVGVGAIVGSAVFNLFCICALAAVFAGQTLHLDWRPLCRDATFYAISIICFIFVTWDGKVEIWESVIMLCLYFIYILIMKFNPYLMKALSACCGKKSSKVAAKSLSAEANERKAGDDQSDDEDDETRRFSHVQKGVLSKKIVGTSSKTSLVIAANTDEAIPGQSAEAMPTIPGSQPPIDAEPSESFEEVEETLIVAENLDEDEDDGPECKLLCMPTVQIGLPDPPEGGFLSYVKVFFSWILFIVAFPFIILFTYTIPDCSEDHNRKWYLVSFCMSIFWIAALSFAMVTLVGRAGCILGIDKFTMGLVVVAIGTSIPDALSSILVARDGYGDMAVSNAIGSNVFDIDLGVGLPFVISSLIRKTPVFLLTHDEQAAWDAGQLNLLPHPKFGFILLILLVFAMLVFAAARFKLSKRLAISFFLMYIIFLCYAFIQELVCDFKC